MCDESTMITWTCISVVNILFAFKKIKLVVENVVEPYDIQLP